VISVTKVELVIAGARDQGITLVVTETFRSAPRQQYLFANHKTQLDGKTPASIGVHHFGLAIDVMREENGKADWSTDDYLFLQRCTRNMVSSGVATGASLRNSISRASTTGITSRGVP